jgi:hypothetical protein
MEVNRTCPMDVTSEMNSTPLPRWAEARKKYRSYLEAVLENSKQYFFRCFIRKVFNGNIYKNFHS